VGEKSAEPFDAEFLLLQFALFEFFPTGKIVGMIDWIGERIDGEGRTQRFECVAFPLVEIKQGIVTVEEQVFVHMPIFVKTGVSVQVGAVLDTMDKEENACQSNLF